MWEEAGHEGGEIFEVGVGVIAGGGDVVFLDVSGDGGWDVPFFEEVGGDAGVIEAEVFTFLSGPGGGFEVGFEEFVVEVGIELHEDGQAEVLEESCGEGGVSVACGDMLGDELCGAGFGEGGDPELFKLLCGEFAGVGEELGGLGDGDGFSAGSAEV